MTDENFEQELAAFTAGNKKRNARILGIGGVILMVVGLTVLIAAIAAMMGEAYHYGQGKTLVVSAGLVFAGGAMIAGAIREARDARRK
jgi:multisubunit Na+/H+ antiporter MnhB subunit